MPQIKHEYNILKSLNGNGKNYLFNILIRAPESLLVWLVGGQDCYGHGIIFLQLGGTAQYDLAKLLPQKHANAHRSDGCVS